MLGAPSYLCMLVIVFTVDITPYLHGPTYLAVLAIFFMAGLYVCYMMVYSLCTIYAALAYLLSGDWVVKKLPANLCVM